MLAEKSCGRGYICGPPLSARRYAYHFPLLRNICYRILFYSKLLILNNVSLNIKQSMKQVLGYIQFFTQI